MSTKDTVRENIVNTIKPNNNQEITGSNTQGVLLDILDLVPDIIDGPGQNQSVVMSQKATTDLVENLSQGVVKDNTDSISRINVTLGNIESDVESNTEKIAFLEGSVIYIGVINNTTQELLDGDYNNLLEARAIELRGNNKKGYSLADLDNIEWWCENANPSTWNMVGGTRVVTATNQIPGIVQGNTSQDYVSVQDGKMVVNNISASKVKGVVETAKNIEGISKEDLLYIGNLVSTNQSILIDHSEGDQGSIDIEVNPTYKHPSAVTSDTSTSSTRLTLLTVEHEDEAIPVASTSATYIVNTITAPGYTSGGFITSIVWTGAQSVTQILHPIDSADYYTRYRNSLGVWFSWTKSADINYVWNNIQSHNTDTEAHKSIRDDIAALPTYQDLQEELNPLATGISANTSAIGNLNERVEALNGAAILIGKINQSTSGITNQLLNDRAIELKGNVKVGYTLADNDNTEWWCEDSAGQDEGAISGRVSQWNNIGQNVIGTATNDNPGVVQGSGDTDKVGVNALGQMVLNLVSTAKLIGNLSLSRITGWFTRNLRIGGTDYSFMSSYSGGTVDVDELITDSINEKATTIVQAHNVSDIAHQDIRAKLSTVTELSSNGLLWIGLVQQYSSAVTDSTLNAILQNWVSEINEARANLVITDLDGSMWRTKSILGFNPVTADWEWTSRVAERATTATTATNSDNSSKLQGLTLTTTDKIYSAIPHIQTDGVMGVGRFIDFHTSTNDDRDFATRVNCMNVEGTGNDVMLPTGNGTLALTSDNVASATNAINLGGVAAANYARKDVTTYFNPEISNVFRIDKAVIGGGSWAYAPWGVVAKDGSSLSQIGVFGNANVLAYTYLGYGYSDTRSLRIYPDSIRRGNNVMLDAANYNNYALPLSGGFMNVGAGIDFHSNTHSWDDMPNGLSGISTLSDAYGYYGGISFKGYYGMQIRTYGGDVDSLTYRGYNGANWGSWRTILHTANYTTYAPPKNHVSSDSTYGVGNTSYYGHLKLSDTVNSTQTSSSGTATTPKAVYDAIDDIEVGGANLLLNSDRVYFNGTVPANGTVGLENYYPTHKEGYVSIQFKAHGNVNVRYARLYVISYNTAGEQVAWNTSNAPSEQEIAEVSAIHTLVLPANGISRYHIAARNVASGDFGGLQFSHLKVETGTKPTNWTPNIADKKVINNWTIEEVDGNLNFKYGGVTKQVLLSNGDIQAYF